MRENNFFNQKDVSVHLEKCPEHFTILIFVNNAPFRTSNLIAEFAPDCEVVMHGSTELVLMTENYAQTGQYDETELAEILQPFATARDESGLDQLVLGCTHFALLHDQIDELLPGVVVVDSSEAIARQVVRILESE